MAFILQWIDLIWLVPALTVPQKHQRLSAVIFMLCSMVFMRLQAELMDSIGHANGLAGLLDLPVFYRLLLVYSGIYAGFFVMAHYSREAKKAIFFAAALSLFFTALFISSIVMVL